MRFLLDTHTFLWAITDYEKLSKKAKLTLEDPSQNILVSAISFWEISLKFSIGKLLLNGIAPDEFPPLATQTGFEIIQLSAEEAASYHKLTGKWHRDPFDRMLIWQALQQDLILISKDKNIGNYKNEGLKTLW